MRKIGILILMSIFVIAGIIAASKFLTSKAQKGLPAASDQGPETKYWTCAMHPSVRVNDAEYKKGKVNCPICNMPLIPAQTPHPFASLRAGSGPLPRGERELSGPFPRGEREYNFSLSPEGGEGWPADRQAEGEGGQEVQEAYYGCGVKEEGHCPHCDEGKPDADCICGQHSFMLKAKAGEKLYCPVCKVELKEIKPEEIKTVVQEENILSRVKLNPRQTELAGIVTVPIDKKHLTKEIKTVGRIAFDPELRVAQEEFLTALQTRQKVSESPDPDVIRRAEDLLGKSRLRLKLLGMSDEQISELEMSKIAESSLVLPEDKVWVYAEVYEYEIGWIKPGQETRVTTTAFPGEEFKGTIRSINPVLDPKTRSVRVRLQIDNPELKLKPEMFVDVKIEATYIGSDGSHEVLAVPKEAVLDTGLRKIVYVDTGNGTFLGKEVILGPEAGVDIGGQKQFFYPVLKGLSGDETLVTKGNFLIDSQSQLTGGMSVLWGGAQEIKEEVETKHQH